MWYWSKDAYNQKKEKKNLLELYPYFSMVRKFIPINVNHTMMPNFECCLFSAGTLGHCRGQRPMTSY